MLRADDDRAGAEAGLDPTKPVTVFRGAAVADGTSDRPQLNMSVVVQEGRICWMGPTNTLPQLPTATRIVDSSGCTIVPGLVDSHTHVTLPGGAQFMDHGFDDLDTLLDTARDNVEIAARSGVRWQRDVGAPVRSHPVTGLPRAATLNLREEATRSPTRLSVAGAWIAEEGFLPAGFDVRTREELLQAGAMQIDGGADLVKIMLDSPDPDRASWSPRIVAEFVSFCHDHGRPVAAHATNVKGARVAAEAGVDTIEHGTYLDQITVDLMAARGITLVSTLCVYRSWQSFGHTTDMADYASPEGRARADRLWHAAARSVRLADEAGVTIAAGTDAGGGSTRANHLAWEFESLIAAGLTPQSALAAVTWRGGDVIGSSDAGRLRIGGPADFALVHGDPLSDPAALWRVWKTSWLDR